MKEKLKSRKLWATILTAIIVAVNGGLNLVPDETINWIVQLVMVYIGGQAVADAVGNYKKKEG